MQHIWSVLNNAIRTLAPATRIYTLTTSVWSCTAVRQTTQTHNNSERHKYSKRTQSNPQTWGPIYMFTDINVYVFNFINIYLHIYIRTYVRSGYQPESIPRLAPHDEQKDCMVAPLQTVPTGSSDGCSILQKHACVSKGLEARLLNTATHT